MAEIANSTAAKHVSGKRICKKSTRVDLTPMVDLGFLLITFFVFTSALSKPRAMSLVTPDDRGKEPTVICESCALTVMLGNNNRVFYYEGIPENNPIVKELSFTSESIRTVLLQKLQAVKTAKGSADDMVLVIKPGEGSAFKNFVDMVDEVAINNIKHYFIDEMNATDKKLLLPMQ